MDNNTETKTSVIDAREDAVRTLLVSLGENPDRPGLVDTPNRVARMFSEVFEGYNEDPKEILNKKFPNDSGNNNMVIIKDIDFNSYCEHHMVPFIGTVSIAYIPGDFIVGLSKFVRLVACFSKRLQVQERLTDQIAHALQEHLGTNNVAVLIKAEHMCMRIRGVRNQGAETITSELGGVFSENPSTRAEFMTLIQ